MKLGILKTGDNNEKLRPRFGEYPDMFVRLFGAADPSLRFQSWPVLDGQFPDSVTDCDGWIVTGSRHGVYDDLPWMAPLKQFLRNAIAAKVPVLGVCFGHQILADAMGGKVEKSTKGWGVGRHDYAVNNRPAFMADAPATLSFHAMHQDQVVIKPEMAHVVASSPFCEYAMLAYGQLDAPSALSIQPHPEFDVDFERALLELRTGAVVPEALGRKAIDGLGQAPTHSAEFARWALGFFRQAQAARSVPAHG